MLTGWQLFGAVVILLGVLGAVLICLRPQRVPYGRTVSEIRSRIIAEAVVPTLPGPPPTALLWHGAPDRPPQVAEAHRIMQQHLECAADGCARKAAARRALIEAGRLKPR